MKKAFTPYVSLPFLMLEKEVDIDLHLVRIYWVNGHVQMDLNTQVPESLQEALMDDALSLLGFSQCLAKEDDSILFYAPISRLLDHLYMSSEQDPILHRLMCAIRLYMHSQMALMSNTNDGGEKLLILSLSLETLFHLYPTERKNWNLGSAKASGFDLLKPAQYYNRTKVSGDLKWVLRSLLDLKCGRNIEMMWKWCDGFFRAIDAFVHCESNGDQIFKENLNYNEYYGEIALKIFHFAILSIFLDKLGFDAKFMEKGAFNRIDICCYFWSEEALLHKIVILLMQVAHKASTEEVLLELKELSGLWVHMRAHPHFVESDPHVLKTKTERVLALLTLIEENEKAYELAKRYIHPRLIQELHVAA